MGHNAAIKKKDMKIHRHDSFVLSILFLLSSSTTSLTVGSILDSHGLFAFVALPKGKSQFELAPPPTNGSGAGFPVPIASLIAFAITEDGGMNIELAALATGGAVTSQAETRSHDRAPRRQWRTGGTIPHRLEAGFDS